MEKIVVAGGTGFIGYHIAKKALKRKFKVYCISKKPPPKNRFLKQVKYIYCDLSKKNLKINKIKFVNYIVNCSGYGIHSIKNNLKDSFFDSHYQSAKNLVKSFNSKKLKKFVQIGTSLEYAPSKNKIKENYKCEPKSIYGKAKLSTTKYLLYLHDRFNFPVIIFRAFQIYGPKQDINRLIPFVIKKCKDNKKFNCTSGQQVRNFCYIDDLVDAVFLSLKKKIDGEIFNIGVESSFKVKEVIQIIKKKIGKGKPIFGKKKMHKAESLKIVPNLIKIKKKLGWKPKFNFYEGLNKTLIK